MIQSIPLYFSRYMMYHIMKILSFCTRFCVVTCFLDFSVSVGAFVIGLSQISSFFSQQQNKTCGHHTCNIHQTCVTPKVRQRMCMPPETELCQRYLVTGPYGVTSDKVTFSTIHFDLLADHSQYQLDSDLGWHSALDDQNPWTQVIPIVASPGPISYSVSIYPWPH